MTNKVIIENSKRKKTLLRQLDEINEELAHFCELSPVGLTYEGAVGMEL